MKSKSNPSQAKIFAVPHIKVLAVNEAEVLDPVCNTPEALCRVWRETVAAEPLFDPEKEVFAAFFLNRKNRLKAYQIVTIGTLGSALVHPREVFRPAIAQAAAGVIAAHNHPSGDPSPSSADIQVTRQLREAARVLGIDLIDHVIVGDSRLHCGPGHYSFREAGLI